MRQIAVVGAALLRAGKCLVAQRGPGSPDTGKWEFPGGKVERGETPQEALARELREELGIEVEVGAYLGCGQVEQQRPHEVVRIVLEVYAARLVAGEPQCREHQALTWLTAEALSGVDWAAADRPIVSAVQACLQHRAPS